MYYTIDLVFNNTRSIYCTILVFNNTKDMYCSIAQNRTIAYVA